MNCTIRTFIPYPMARTAIPRHEVVFPFPSPVMTSTSPLRGFSGIRSGDFRGSIASPLRFVPPWDDGGAEPIPGEEYSRGSPCGIIVPWRGKNGGHHEQEPLHGLCERRGVRGRDLRAVQ